MNIRKNKPRFLSLVTVSTDKEYKDIGPYKYGRQTSDSLLATFLAIASKLSRLMFTCQQEALQLIDCFVYQDFWDKNFLLTLI